MVVKMEEQMSVQCTLQDCQEELRRYLISFAVTLNDLYGEHALRSVMGESGSLVSDEEIMESVDMNRFELYLRLPDAYDYAFKGKMGGLKSATYFELLRDLLAVADHHHNASVEVVWQDYFHDFGKDCLRRLLEIGEARDALDFGARLTAKDIALLAGIAERSVQNAFSLKGAGKLKATRYGNVSFVDVEDARQWLADKKGFIPTVKIQFLDTEELPVSLDSQAELRAFLSSRVFRLRNEEERNSEGELPKTDLGEILGIAATVAEDKLIYGTKPIQLSDACQFASRLNIDRRWLAQQILRINHPQEAEVLLGNN
jgi:hypothetical protein